MTVLDTILGLLAEQYFEKALPIVEERHGKLKKYKIDMPLPAMYHPEVDTSPILRDANIELY